VPARLEKKHTDKDWPGGLIGATVKYKQPDYANNNMSFLRARPALAAGALTFLISGGPAPAGQSYMGYSADLRFADLTVADFADTGSNGSYISIAEPGRSDVQLTLGQITGNLSMANGRVDLIPEAEAAPRTAQLMIGNDILFGTTVAGGAPLLVNAVSLGGNNVGSIAIPSGQWYGSFALMKQR
jgi:hypothetical protein